MVIVDRDRLAGSRPRAEEVEHPLDQVRGGVRVVGRQRAVGEIVLVAGAEEQFGVAGLPGKLASGVTVARAGEDRIGIRPVHLHRHPAAGWHLRTVFAKLGISCRGELRRALPGLAEVAGPA